MLRRITAALLSALAGSALAGNEQISIGESSVAMPAGWKTVERSNERAVFRTIDDRQQATIAVLRFAMKPSLQDFERLCTLRIEAERKELIDGFVQEEPATSVDGAFRMSFFGGDRSNARIFSGLLKQSNLELVTIYVEGAGVGPNEHLDSFASIVGGLR